MRAAIAACVVCGCAGRPIAVASPDEAEARAAIARFNQEFEAATRRMDNAALLAQWADDGVSLLPKTAPIVGKPAVTAFVTSVLTGLQGAHMIAFTQECHGLEITGAWASEWCQEHQQVALPNGQPPFDGRGTLLLVLHRGDDGRWRIAREMWNEAAPP